MKSNCIFSVALTLLLAGGALAQRPARKVVQARPEPKSEPKAEPKKETKLAPPAPSVLRGPTRIDFDDRLVQGQTNKLGAVYLYQRKDPAQPSLLERRKSFREEILKDVVE